MILEAIIGLFKTIALFIINLLPTFPDFSSFLNTSFDSFFDVLHSVNFFVDLKVVGFCVIALFIFANIEFIFSIIMWIVRKIPGVS